MDALKTLPGAEKRIASPSSSVCLLTGDTHFLVFSHAKKHFGDYLQTCILMSLIEYAKLIFTLEMLLNWMECSNIVELF